MALVAGRWFLIVNLMDNGRNVTAKRYELFAADAAGAQDAVDLIIPALNGVTSAVIKSHFHYNEFVEDALTTPASGVEIENQALLLFDIQDAPSKTATHSIPAPDPAIFMATSGAGANVIDTADAAVIAYRDLFRAGASQAAYLSDGEIAESLISGKRIHRASRRG